MPDPAAGREGLRYPLERAFTRVLTPFQEFIARQSAGGVVLLLGAVAALVWANSPWGDDYRRLVATPVSLSMGGWAIERSLLHWVSEGLMAFFFFLVGLELKRELIAGELSGLRRAALPIIAAAGGMLVPALIFLAVNASGPFTHGWGIPTATDIAFSIGALVALGNRVPRGLMILLVAVAIADDLGAVLVIALFYGQSLVPHLLVPAALCLLACLALNLGGVRSPVPYAALGLLMWFFLLDSGVHAVLAGVAVAFCVPARPLTHPDGFSREARSLLNRYDSFERDSDPRRSLFCEPAQFDVLRTLERGIERAESPLQRLEARLAFPVSFVILPLFALASSGIQVDLSRLGESLTHPVTLGVALALLLGKPAGIVLATLLAVRTGAASLPSGVGARHLAGMGMLGGIGFTMSLFVAELSFPGHPEALVFAKMGILCGSFLSFLAGFLWLRGAAPRVKSGTSPT